MVQPLTVERIKEALEKDLYYVELKKMVSKGGVLH